MSCASDAIPVTAGQKSNTTEKWLTNKITFGVEDLYREAEPVLCPDIADDDIDIFSFTGAKVILWFNLCLLGGSFIVIRPDLSRMLVK